MFHPVGRQSPSVYWRRRLWFLAALIALVALIAVTARVVLAKGGGTPNAGGSSSHTSVGRTPPRTSSSHQPPPSSSHSSSQAASSTGGSTPASSSVVPLPCVASALSIAAVTSQASYPVDAQPTLSMQVTNTGSTPCVQNLADSQIVLRVYNGVSRVWGSHDCQVQPGTDNRTLAVNQPVKISVVWSGRSSQPNCAGTRQQVGAGTYTLYASLAGHDGKAAQFSIH